MNLRQYWAGNQLSIEGVSVYFGVNGDQANMYHQGVPIGVIHGIEDGCYWSRSGDTSETFATVEECVTDLVRYVLVPSAA
jgi:hypothetical protein